MKIDEWNQIKIKINTLTLLVPKKSNIQYNCATEGAANLGEELTFQAIILRQKVKMRQHQKMPPQNQ